MFDNIDVDGSNVLRASGSTCEAKEQLKRLGFTWVTKIEGPPPVPGHWAFNLSNLTKLDLEDYIADFNDFVNCCLPQFISTDVTVNVKWPKFEDA